MALSEAPLWCRIILSILTIGSFLPQIFCIQARQSIHGISSLSILWNLISATEQLTAFFYVLITEYNPEGGAILLHSPPTTGDWFSLCHCAVVTVLFLVLFTQVLFYSDRSTSLAVSYTSFLLISIIPLLIDTISPIDDEAQRWWSAIFAAVHLMLLWPSTTILGSLSIYHQARKIFAVPFPNSLSLQGLAVQAVIFALISVVWIWCLPFPYHELKGNMGWSALSAWYGTIGWIIVDSFVFAFGQAVLLALALRRVSLDELTMQRGGEIEPLLG